MKDIIGFLIIVLAPTLDPIRLGGYLLAGATIKKRGIAVAAGVIWMLITQLFTFFVLKKLQSTSPPIYIVGAIINSILVTLLVHSIANKARANKQR
jgi:hypothetical protein